MNQCTDDLTRSLFARLRRSATKVMEPESALLKCPKCPNRLRPLLLDFFEDKGETYQRVWWTCRGLKTKTCIFPLNMPPDVFWTKRTEEQARHNVIPLPNFKLLPKELWSLYPALFSKNKLTVDRSYSSSKQRIKSGSLQESSECSAVDEADANTKDGSYKPTPTEDHGETSSDRRKRKSRMRRSKNDELSPGKKQMRGVVHMSSVKLDNAVAFSSLRRNRRKTMQPIQERMVTGGRNFDFNFVDESTPVANANRVQLFPDIQSSLKSALALRFAKKDYLDKVNTMMCETGTMPFKEDPDKDERRKLLEDVVEKMPAMVEERTSSQEDGNSTEDCETSSSHSSERTEKLQNAAFKMSSKTLSTLRDVEQKISVSSRLGRTVVKDEPSLNRPKSEATTEFNDFFEPICVQSDYSVPSTSNMSIDSSVTPVRPVEPENVTTNFDSPELHNIVQKHIHLLKTKTEKKKRRSSSKRKNESEGNAPDFNYLMNQSNAQSSYDFNFQDEPDYGIFSLGDDDTFGYDVFNAF